MRALMNSILRAVLFAQCAVLSGCHSVRGQGPDVPAVASSYRSQNSTTAPPHEKEQGVADWKTCEQLLHPKGSYAAADIQAMVASPQNITEFLRNLKVAADRGLLLQSAFYDEATLLKFFNGTKVTFTDSNASMDKLSSGIEARLDVDIPPKLSITLASVCRVRKYQANDGSAIRYVSTDGFLSILMGPGPLITLRDIRSALGREDHLYPDRGDPDLPPYTTTDKGDVTYQNVHRAGIEDSRIQTRFYLKANGVSSIEDSDVVRKVEMHDMQDRIDLPSTANSSKTQKPSLVPPEFKGGGVRQWKSCVQRLHPAGGYTASKIQSMFDSPRNVPEFLRALKIASEQGLLLQSSFYTKATLGKFFNASKVTVVKPDAYLGKLSSGIAAHIVSEIFPRVSIKLDSNCTTGEYKATSGSVSRYVAANGFLDIKKGPGPLMTLRDIRSVLGPEQQLYVDREIDVDGNNYAPTYKGSVKYQIGRQAGLEDS